MLNIINFKYSFLIEDDILLTHHKIKKVVYKATSDKTSRYIRYINRIMRRLVNNTSE